MLENMGIRSQYDYKQTWLLSIRQGHINTNIHSRLLRLFLAAGLLVCFKYKSVGLMFAKARSFTGEFDERWNNC